MLRSILRLFVLKSFKSSASKGIWQNNSQRLIIKIPIKNISSYPKVNQLVLSVKNRVLKGQNFYKYNFQKLLWLDLQITSLKINNKTAFYFAPTFTLLSKALFHRNLYRYFLRSLNHLQGVKIKCPPAVTLHQQKPPLVTSNQ
jgi:hypothetical protein